MNRVIYQLALRTFTPEGTLRAATERLGHVASLGVDIVYLCPFYVQDDDEDPDYWSKRQHASKTGNPKNPYKINDYFHVDVEYGTEADLKAFVARAHQLGMLVLFDLVYLHCGRRAIFIEQHPDFVERDEGGNVKVPDRWPFARLNFASRALREYLMQNMAFLLDEFGADGFRCDVGDSVPLDFWQEAFARLKRQRPSLITLNEGIDPAYVDGTFDMGYSFSFQSRVRRIFAGGESVAILRELADRERAQYGKNTKKLLRTLDNHDTASDVGAARNELLMTSRGVDAALVLSTTYEGVPLLWNGCELCDTAENCMFSNRDYGRRSAMDWSGAFTENGKRRLRLVKALHAMRHTVKALSLGDQRFLENTAPDAVISYLRTCEGEQIAVLINATGAPVTVALAEPLSVARPLLRYGVHRTRGQYRMEPYGYLVVNLKESE